LAQPMPFIFIRSMKEKADPILVFISLSVLLSGYVMLTINILSII